MRSTERTEHGLDDVGDIDVVALVAAVAEQRDRLAALPAADEDRDHPAFQVSPLARTEDVREAEGHGAEVRRIDELFGLRFELSVVGLGIDGHGLVRAHGRLAVDRASGRDIHEDRSAEPPRCLEHVARTPDDDALVKLLLGHRFDHFRLRGAVDDGIDPSRADPTLQRGKVGDVRDAEVGVPVEVRAISGGEVVDDHHVVAACEECVDDMTSEKARAAGHEDAQLLAAPLPKDRACVDELVEEMVDKGPTRSSDSTLPFSPARGASAAQPARWSSSIVNRTPVLDCLVS